MRILFIFARPNPYDSRTVRALPSGGTEKAVIFLGEALAKLGHDITWATTTDAVRAESERYDYDVVITQIAELLAMPAFQASRKVWWTHHFSDQPVIRQNVAFARAYADRIVTLSKCHAQDFSATLRLDSVTIGHGVWLEEVKTGQKEPYRLIYASTPFRGLERVPSLFRAIQARQPRATIAICSSMGTYGQPEADDAYVSLFRELREIQGVELLGALNQEALYQEYAKASVFFYPCMWPETYCLALDEAIAHRCTPLVTKLGALPERANWSRFPEDFTPPFAWNKDDGEGWKPERGVPTRDWLDVAQQWEAEVLNG